MMSGIVVFYVRGNMSRMRLERRFQENKNKTIVEWRSAGSALKYRPLLSLEGEECAENTQ